MLSCAVSGLALPLFSFALACSPSVPFPSLFRALVIAAHSSTLFNTHMCVCSLVYSLGKDAPHAVAVPCLQAISKLAFEFERRKLAIEEVRELIYREILEYHPQVLQDYLSGGRLPTFLYPSAVDNFKRQFMHLEGGGEQGRLGPVVLCCAVDMRTSSDSIADSASH